MSQGGAGSNSNSRGKSVMNTLRRVFSFRKRPTSTQTSEESSPSSIELQPVNTPSTSASVENNTPRVESQQSSDVPSTSASTARPKRSKRQRVRKLYEDPFVAVFSNGKIYVKHYYNFNSDIQFHTEGIDQEHILRNSRMILAHEIDMVYYAPGPTCANRRVCKDWGICINNVWWASHLTRAEGGNPYTNVVFIDKSMMFPGFTVINIDAFAEVLQCVGLPRDAPFRSGVPNPPLRMMAIPYIDEEVDEDADALAETINNLQLTLQGQRIS